MDERLASEFPFAVALLCSLRTWTAFRYCNRSIFFKREINFVTEDDRHQGLRLFHHMEVAPRSMKTIIVIAAAIIVAWLAIAIQACHFLEWL